MHLLLRQASDRDRNNRTKKFSEKKLLDFVSNTVHLHRCLIVFVENCSVKLHTVILVQSLFKSHNVCLSVSKGLKRHITFSSSELGP